MKKRLFVLFTWLSCLILLPLGILTSCQSKLIYFPRQYNEDATTTWQNVIRGKAIDYQTSQGKQRAFLQGNLTSPKYLWIVCAGNGSVALDWSEWLHENAPKDDAYLLIDYPAYGACEGKPTPKTIRENITTSIPLAFTELKWNAQVDNKRLRFFGHSLGAASCMIAATEFHIQQGVLISPFTSMMEMTKYRLGLPLGFIATHRFDNMARMKELTDRGNGKVIIVHGTADAAIPVTMSRKLKDQNKETIELLEAKDGGHNDLPRNHKDLLIEAIEKARP